MPVTKQALKYILQSLVRQMDQGDLFVYYQVTRGTGRRKHAFTEGPGNLWITLTPQVVSDGREPFRLITTEDTRFMHCNIKTLNLIPSVMAAQKAKEAARKVRDETRRTGFLENTTLPGKLADCTEKADTVHGCCRRGWHRADQSR